MLARANAQITKQLDLVKFVRRQKMLVYTALATLTGPQLNLVHKLGQAQIYESSEIENSSDDNYE